MLWEHLGRGNESSLEDHGRLLGGSGTCAVTWRNGSQSDDWGAKCVNKRERNVQRPRGKRKRMAVAAAQLISSAWNGGHRLGA